MTEDSPTAGANPQGDVTRAPDGALAENTPIGPYRLLQLVGTGGMGDVWLAEQTRPVRRQVAVKIIKAGMDTAEVVARFDAERQALALMDHPCIARVLDGGATPQGRPYFAMEYVRGEQFTTYCTKYKLPIRRRLELFAQICDGVQHAHQKGIIHRDLKPSNVLVAIQDDRPIPKIIDFGVAKATTQTLTERPLHTELGAIIGTPEYMSPEQAEMTGLDVDTRSDIYALGVVLYELLTGTLPFEPTTLRGRGLDEIRRTIREVEPPRPSARVTTLSATAAYERSDALRLASQLRGDLDWITMKALEKDRTQRYQTANAFALDVRRHLCGEPVLAAPPSTSYRLRKFVRRNRVSVAAAAVVVLLLVAFAAAVAVQARRIAQERDRANREATTAKAISAFLQDDLLAQAGAAGQAGPGSKPDPNLTVRTALDRAAERLSVRFGAEPQVEASLQQTIGAAYQELGLYTEAERHLEAASELRRRTLGETHPETVNTMGLLGDLYRLQGKYGQAEEVLKAVVETGRRVLGEENGATQRAIANLAIVYRFQGKYQQAEPLLVKHVEYVRRTSGERDVNTLTAMNNLAQLYSVQGKWMSADEIFTKAIETARDALGNEHPVTITLKNNLAFSYYRQGKYAQAEPLYLAVMEFASRVWGEKHPNTLTTMGNLGSLYTDQGRYSEAVTLLDKAVAVGRVVEGDEHPNTLLTKYKLAELYRAQGNSVQAELLCVSVLASRRRILGEEHPDTLWSMESLAEVFLSRQKYKEAEALLVRLVASRRRTLGKEHPSTLRTSTLLGRALIEQQRYADAESSLREAVNRYEQSAPDDWTRFVSQALLGASLAGQKDYAQAESLLLSGYDGMARLQSRIPVHSQQAVARAGQWIVQMYQEWGKAERASEWRARLLKIASPGR